MVELFTFRGHTHPHVCRGRRLWVVAGFQNKSAPPLRQCANSLRPWVIAFGALFGPVLGVSASLLAVQHTDIGVASTLMALPPVFIVRAELFGGVSLK